MRIYGRASGSTNDQFPWSRIHLIHGCRHTRAMDVRRLDLNLLVVFDAVLNERSVSRAADRLALTQPAVSHALARLRVACGDAIVTRQGKAMVPTPKA